MNLQYCLLHYLVILDSSLRPKISLKQRYLSSATIHSAALGILQKNVYTVYQESRLGINTLLAYTVPVDGKWMVCCRGAKLEQHCGFPELAVTLVVGKCVDTEDIVIFQCFAVVS